MMFRLAFITVAIGLLASIAHADQPNILFIFSDDHALRTIGVYPESINVTPNLDRIAEEGAIFTRSFVVKSICCPISEMRNALLHPPTLHTSFGRPGMIVERLVSILSLKRQETP